MLKPLYRMLIRKRASRPSEWKRGDDEHAYAEWEFASAQSDWAKFYSGRIDLSEKRVIDLGCGLGGRTVFYATLGPDEIVGVDILGKNIIKSKKFATEKDLAHLTKFEVADAGKLAYEDASFDIAFSENSFEHYPDPGGVLTETGRILKPGGLFIINFSQWGAPNGHHLENWASLSWAHLVLGTDELLKLTEEAGMVAVSNSPDERSRAEKKNKLEWDLLHHRECLNRLSIKRFESMLASAGVWEVRHRRRTAAAWWLFPFKSIPGLNELTTGRNVYILERR